MTQKEAGIACGQTWSLAATRQQLDRFFAYLADMDKICGGVLKSNPAPSLGRASGVAATILNIGSETASERKAIASFWMNVRLAAYAPPGEATDEFLSGFIEGVSADHSLVEGSMPQIDPPETSMLNE
jgi:hypothetical protein